ncbi:hypothetical protein [Hominifimenecus sp. rT4P-3]|uniref:hypothetical protein n=1 Tax=Hominifimenecus sp. rT4P-3 TaxID=3242979 RepID=UPI003DA47DD8
MKKTFLWKGIVLLLILCLLIAGFWIFKQKKPEISAGATMIRRCGQCLERKNFL